MGIILLSIEKFYIKQSILWYQKIEFVISKIWFIDTTKLRNVFDIIKSILWYSYVTLTENSDIIVLLIY